MLHKTITLSATLQAVSHFTEELEGWFAPLTMEIRTGVILAVQELCVNIVRHAYNGAAGDIVVEIEWTPGHLRFQFTDHAPNHFNMPETIPEPDPLELQEHGMGLFLIHLAFDQVEYTPTQDQNRWYLFKRLVH